MHNPLCMTFQPFKTVAKKYAAGHLIGESLQMMICAQMVHVPKQDSKRNAR